MLLLLRRAGGFYWSGGAEPASGMRISCVRAGAGWESLSSVRNAGKVPKRAPNEQNTCIAIVKRDMVDVPSVGK